MARQVLVTGASRGLGRASVVELCRRGWTVLAAMRSIERDWPGLEAATAGGPGRVRPLRLDLLDDASITAAIEEALCEGPIDAVCHVAGVAPVATFEDTPPTEWASTFQVNVFGPMALTAGLLPSMRARRTGRVLAVTSSSARVGLPLSSVYGASKSALQRWIESLSIEIAPFGLSAHALEAGFFATDLLEGAVPPSGGPYGAIYERVAPQRARFLRLSKPPEVFARVLADTLDARRPPVVRPVGADARSLHAAQHLVPMRMLNRLLRLGFR